MDVEVQPKPLVVVLLNGNELLFPDKLVVQAVTGGAEAARLLMSNIGLMIHEHDRLKEGMRGILLPGRLVVVHPDEEERAFEISASQAEEALLTRAVLVNIFVNIRKQHGIFRDRAEVSMLRDKYEDFWVGVASHPQLNVVLIGGKKGAGDAEIATHYQLYRRLPGMETIVLGESQSRASITAARDRVSHPRLILVRGRYRSENLRGNYPAVVYVPTVFQTKNFPVQKLGWVTGAARFVPNLESVPFDPVFEPINYVAAVDQHIAKFKLLHPGAEVICHLHDAGAKPCLVHYLMLSPMAKVQLARHAKKLLCVQLKRGRECHDAGTTCIFGHRCYWGAECQRGPACHFTQYDIEHAHDGEAGWRTNPELLWTAEEQARKVLKNRPASVEAQARAAEEHSEG